MRKNLIIFLIILTIIGAGLIFTFAQNRPGFGLGMMGMRPGMMESVDSEYEFLIKMIPHHEEAIRKSKILRDNTNREKMREFAKNIIKVQNQEIKEMKKYLAKWYPNKTNDYQYEPMMGNYEGLAGEELDYSFLKDMIPHHMGAVMMSQQLIIQGLDEHQEVYLLAKSIRKSQRQEIIMMRNWLDNWY